MDPADHCAFNVILYGPRASRWAMTERGAEAAFRSRTVYALGPSRMEWNGTHLKFDINEVCFPVFRKLEGTVTVTPSVMVEEEFALAANFDHWWRPLSPRVDVAVAFSKPSLHWRGTGYLDSNGGRGPIERDFREWDWARVHDSDGARIRYNCQNRDGARNSLALGFDAQGNIRSLPLQGCASLAPTRIWKMPRQTTSNFPLRITKTLEDTPFYSRSIISEQASSGPRMMMHESISFLRFEKSIVQAMLPFRMPRRSRWKASGA
ncbi:MAG: carotenoid 1,2-hydratase [Rhodospirillaceae bacterium]|nr:carotenoid 1,2-hydratase [Rhodospirillaceae bacterium]MCY4310565.1 carotenoid 1,2-hydratase [Rhodospirillaceae bacterium]